MTTACRFLASALLFIGPLFSGESYVRAEAFPSEQTGPQQVGQQGTPVSEQPQPDAIKPIGFSNGMGLPESAIPAKFYIASKRVIIAISDDNKRVFGYSERAPRWAVYDLDEPIDRKRNPIVSTDVAVVVTKSACVAYSSQLGRWDAVPLDNETVAPAVATNYVQLHTKKTDYVFQNAWGRWYSAEDILAGRVTGEFPTPGEAESGLSGGFFLDRSSDGQSSAETAITVSVGNLQQQYRDAEMEVQRLVQEIGRQKQTSAVTPAEREKLRAKVAAAFETRQRLLKAQLRESQKQLLMLRQFLDERDGVATQVIEQRVNDLIPVTERQ